MILQAYSSEKINTIFSMVRFGNVLGSSGSVVPLFWSQIRNGGPITITHKDITRYFMTNTEAVKLVIQASSMSNGGDVFVLDMGVPVKIKNLAIKMIKLSGKTLKNKQNPYGDIEIKIVGLRPGEKLYEEVLLGNNPSKTKHPRIMRASEKYLALNKLENKLEK
jgi:FlaA1/EpsC-like NDP-sugar epimerase